MWDAYGGALVPHQSSNLAAFDRIGLSPGPDASGHIYRAIGGGDAHGPQPLRPNACNPMLADARDPMQYSLQPCAYSLWPYVIQVEHEIPEAPISPMAAVATATESAKAAAKAAFMTKDEILARAALL